MLHVQVLSDSTHMYRSGSEFWYNVNVRQPVTGREGASSGVSVCVSILLETLRQIHGREQGLVTELTIFQQDVCLPWLPRNTGRNFQMNFELNFFL
jgi:hypothetical protein